MSLNYCPSWTTQGAAPSQLSLARGPKQLESTEVAMKFTTATVCAVAVLVSMVTPALAKPAYIDVDPPNAYQSYPTAINTAGDIAGWYWDDQSAARGFVRFADGTFKTFAVADNEPEISILGINDKGEISGTWFDDKSVYHGFVRKPSGKVEVIDPPHSTGTFLFGVNAIGQAAGYVYEADHTQAFVDKGTKYQVFSVPDGDLDTEATAINDNSDVLGMFVSTFDHKQHLFIRDKSNNVTTFDVDYQDRLNPVAISNSGYAVGYTLDGAVLSFERFPNGHLKFISPSPDATNTTVTGVRDDGATAGYYFDRSGGLHGFIATAAGKGTTIDDPKADNYTYISATNNGGLVVGTYRSLKTGVHGFLRTP